MDRLWFQNIYRLNRRPYLPLLDVKEKCMRYAGVHLNLRYTPREVCTKPQICLNKLITTHINQTSQHSWPSAGQIYVISMEFSAVNYRRSCETPLGPKKDGCFRRLKKNKMLPFQITVQPLCTHLMADSIWWLITANQFVAFALLITDLHNIQSCKCRDYSLQIDNSFGQIKPFTFNEAFGEETSQEEMFDGCGIKHLVEMAVEGLVPGRVWFNYKIS